MKKQLGQDVYFKHVSWLTHNLVDALAFYTLLGAGELKREQTSEGYGRAVLHLGGVQVQLLEIAGEMPQPHAHWAEHIALEVQDLPGLVVRLTSAGYSLSREIQPSPSGRLMAFVSDPDGRQIELLQLPVS